ncbi:hypothetical protein IFU08_09760 [Microbacterium sp. CFBP 8790]|uniref:hypothetical protein n=1 Tax=unclassified Microbacterium TaxID=2609290 RepID=UPI00177FE04C|nr:MULTISPECIES: hypothetical protein [unclassified Microbacterium]MBD8509850.1 hypothetical protein [Microbacterium sp. CFBP 8790]
MLLTIAGATVAVPAGARISVGIQPRSALVLDREQILHCLTVEDGRVVEIADLPREYVAELRSRAFPSR